MIEVVDNGRTWRNISSNWRIVFIIFFIALILFALGRMCSASPEIVDNGKAELLGVDFK